VSATADIELSAHEKRLVIVYWWLFALSSAILMPLPGNAPTEGLSPALKLLLSPLALLAGWVAALTLKDHARALLRRIPFPSPLKFALIASGVGLVVALRFALGMDLGTTDPGARVVATLTYFAVYATALAGWYVLRWAYAFHHYHVFWLGGVMFAMCEQNRAVLSSAAAGDLLGASLMLAHLIPSFGVPFAVVFLLMPHEDLPQRENRPDWVGYALLSALPVLLYHGFAPVWLRLLDLTIFATV
jgi:hypothetical protein